jgi:hypothetical protein
MPINRLLAGTAAAPEEVARLNDAYERALSDLGLVDRNDPLTEMVAKRVIEIGRTITDPAKISQRAVESLALK